MKPGIFTAVILINLLALGCGREKTPEDIVRAYIEAQNNHDVDEKMKYFDEETAFVTPGSGLSYMTEDDIRSMSQYDSVLNTTLIIENLTVDGSTVICEMTERNRWLDAAGLPPMHYDSTLFYVIGDKIRKIVSFPDDSTLQGMSDVLDKFIPWLSEKYPYEAMDMMPGGQFQYSAENAEKMILLLEKWRQANEED